MSGTGDVDLMIVDDPQLPFGRVRDELDGADKFSNLECCHSLEDEGFFAASIRRLGELGIPHTGAGSNAAAGVRAPSPSATAPATASCRGVASTG